MLGNRTLAASLFAVALSLPLAARAQDYALADSTDAYQGIAATEGTTLFTDSDDGFTAIDLPFTFRLYGKAYTKAWVSVNGAISFAGQDGVTGQLYRVPGSNVALPSGAQPNAIVAAFWDDWVASPSAAANAGSRVAWQVQGTAPNRFVLVDWKSVQLYGDTGATNRTYSFSLRLYEGSDQYEVRFGPKTGTASNPPLAVLSGSSGSENALGTVGFLHLGGCTPSCGETSFVPGTGKLVSPNQNPELSLTLTLGAVGTAANGDGGPTVTMTVANAGKTGAQGVTYDLYLSKDALLDQGDTKLDLAQLGLAPFDIGARDSTSGVFSQSFLLPLAANVLGTRYVLGVVDPRNAIPEINKANNAASTGAFVAGSELTVRLTGQASAVAGEKAAFTATVANAGSRAADGVVYRVLFSSSTLASPRELFRSAPFHLDGLAQVQQAVQVDVPGDVLPGTFQVNAEVDPANAVPEGDETNNKLAAPLDFDVRGPDVAVDSVEVGGSTGYQGLTVPMRVVLENRGPAKTGPFSFSVYLSANDVITLRDVKVFTSPALSLTGGQGPKTINVAASIPADVPPGVYYVGVIADAEGQVLETDRTNNVRRADGKLAVAVPVPDLAVGSVVAQATAAAGETARVSALASNVGAAAAEFGYGVYLSQNATVSALDTKVAEGRLSLAPGAQQVLTVDARVPATLSAGPYVLGVLLDPAQEVAESDEQNNLALAPAPVQVAEPALGITTPSLPDAVAGVPYDVLLAAKGSGGACTWSVKAGVLPQGLSLDAAGRLSGTPLAQGVSAFVVQAAKGGNVALATYTLGVRAYAASLGFVDSRLPSGRRGTSYAQQVGAAGGNPPYTFTLDSGELPPGLALAKDGTFSGLPTTVGTYQPVLRLEDNAGHRTSAAVKLEILPEGALAFSTTHLPEPEVGKTYQGGALRVDGGKAPYVITLLDGQLPAGLSLTSDDAQAAWALSGTATKAGLYSFTLAVSDSRSERDVAHFVLRANQHGIAFVTVNLEGTAPGQSYLATIDTSARAPAAFSLAAGDLPPGLKLDQSGTISGTVAQDAPPRAYAFAVKVEDGAGGSAVGPFAISVRAPLLSTDGGSGGGGCQTAQGSGLPLALVLLLMTLLRLRRAPARLFALASAAGLFLLAPAAHAQYRVTRETAAFSALTGANTIYDTATDTTTTQAQPLPLPFPFKFYGTYQTSIGVSSAGLLTFGAVSKSYSNTKIPSGGAGNYIAPFWDDLRLSSTTPSGGASVISSKVEGSAPNRVFALEWKNMQRNLSTQSGASYGAYSFQVRLYEGTNEISLHYGGAAATLGTAPTLTATMGIEAPGGQSGIDTSDTKCSPGCAANAFPANGVVHLKLAPDLAIDSVDAPPSIFATAPTSVRTVLHNVGGADTSGVRLRFLLSTDTLVDPMVDASGALVPGGTDIDLAAGWATAVGYPAVAGSTYSVTTQLVVPETDAMGHAITPGLYQLLVVADPLDQIAEVSEDNNVSAAVTVGVAPPAPDFLVTNLLAPTVAEPGKTLSVARTIRNAGNKAGVASYKLVLSTNALVSDADRVLDQDDSVQLAAGQSLALPSQVALPSDVAPGRYWLGLLVRPADGAAELNALNDDKVFGPITVRGGALAISTDAVPQVVAGVPFSIQLTAAGGQGDYKWTSGIPALPAGVSLSDTGILSGVLDAPGTWPFQVLVTSGSTVLAKTFQLVAGNKGIPLALVSHRLPIGLLAAPYAASLAAQGGAPPYAWQLVGASRLPDGLVLASDGAIEGVPLADGQNVFQVRVTDSGGATAEGDVLLPVAGPTQPLFSTRELPAAQLGKSYAATLQAAGGQAPYRFTVMDSHRLASGVLDQEKSLTGSLPPGLALAESGALSGTPTVAGIYVVTVRVADAASSYDTSTFALAVSVDSDLVIRTSALPDAVVGSEYDEQLSAALAGQTGAGNVRWHVSLLEGASLPAGLTFTEEGKIVGFPLSAGSIGFLAVATDDQGRYAMRPLALRVVDAPVPQTTNSSCNEAGSAGVLALLAAALFALRTRKARLAPVAIKIARRGSFLAAALLLSVLAGCTAKPAAPCATGCAAGLACDPLDGICKCGGQGGAVCSAGETCDATARQCLVATCQTSCPQGTTCAADGACHCGTQAGPVCAQGEACDGLGQCARPDVCQGVVCAAGMSCDASQQGACACGPGGPACKAGERCTNGSCVADRCLGVSCTGGTSCDPADGVCKCGGSGGAVCVNGEACDPVNARCIRTSRCQGVSCAGGTSCDPADGLCKCGGPGGARCGEGQSCDPLAKTCSGGDLCQGVTCAARLSCDPEDGVCKCGGFGGSVCGANQLCVISGVKASCETTCDPFAAQSPCAAGRTCRWNQAQAQALCAPLGFAKAGDDCALDAPCAAGLHCVLDSASSTAGVCVAYCRSASDCDVGDDCTLFPSSTLGTCGRSATP